MKKVFGVIAALGFMLMLQLNNSCSAAEDRGNVFVSNTKLGDYGANFTVSSTVGRTTCVFPRVTSSDNVTGSVVGMMQLEPNEKNVNIGQFIQSDSSRAWSVEVAVSGHIGSCADQ